MANVEFNSYKMSKNSNNLLELDITLNIFFDGTLNNKDNSDSRNPAHKHYKDFLLKGQNKKKDTSYYNDWSNVARLWDTSLVKEDPIYIEGIGTEDYKKDNLVGYSTGKGTSGIRFKVLKGCEKISNKVKAIMVKHQGKTINSITLNVFGFSRGAAAARNFTAELRKPAYKARYHDGQFYDRDNMICQPEMPEAGHLGYCLSKIGVTLSMYKIKINFLGIFDTVSSYGGNFRNDIADLSLNNLSAASKVVHFTARDEFREKFALTRIPSDNSNGTSKEKKRIEFDFPGVHSDVGGSYQTGPELIKEIETSWTFKRPLEKLSQQLLDEGWYRDGDLSITGGNAYFALRGEKAKVYKEYSYIPLHFMAMWSMEYGTQLNLKFLLSKYSIKDHPTLISAKKRLRGYVFDDQKYPYFNLFSHSTFNELKNLRYHYFHRSARREGIGMDPDVNYRRYELEK